MKKLDKKKLNATFIVGNGFDIGILNALKNPHQTSYAEFYNYLEFFLKNKKNKIYQEIKNNEQYKKSDKDILWSDFEVLLGDFFNKEIPKCVTAENYNCIINDFEEIQYQFADFMNQVISPDTLKEVSKLDGKKTLESFVFDLEDTDLENCNFFQTLDNHTQLNFNFINFNYSSLFDNYIYWQFDPHPFKVSDNNSFFYSRKDSALNKLMLKDVESSERRNHFKFIETTHTMFHPHGHISIPASILFGISKNGTYESTIVDSDTPGYFQEELRKRIDKSYWSQAESTYESMIKSTDIFIIFGHSIGQTDEWWWNNVLNQLNENKKAEVIIYGYTDCESKKNTLNEELLKYAKEIDVKKIKERIYLIEFGEHKPLKFGFTFE